ncbi:hypothetical protein CC86DRAFT_388512 [Ophiobolus disseminans]|uniref:Uncharacterized protein n=1 Tax=Ophiobolus disseminans TaxID=1469910 RepID=A0A6A6ZDJ2_9PLEO|nr:hypothetical protein CC86DRAFT_388512 [Ophiobolus disseminans]
MALPVLRRSRRCGTALVIVDGSGCLSDGSRRICNPDSINGELVVSWASSALEVCRTLSERHGKSPACRACRGRIKGSCTVPCDVRTIKSDPRLKHRFPTMCVCLCLSQITEATTFGGCCRYVLSALFGLAFSEEAPSPEAASLTAPITRVARRWGNMKGARKTSARCAIGCFGPCTGQLREHQRWGPPPPAARCATGGWMMLAEATSASRCGIKITSKSRPVYSQRMM